MTEPRIQRLRAKLRDARARLMDRHPYFALLLMYLRFVAVPDMKKISTNAWGIYFSPDYLDKLYRDELDYLLCHQILHITLGHVWRPADRASDDYHLACDIMVNSILSELGFDEEKYPHLGMVQRAVLGSKIPVRDMAEDEIYENFSYSLYDLDDRARARFLPDTDPFWDRKEDCDYGGTVILDVPEMRGALRAPGGGQDEDADGDQGEKEGTGDFSRPSWQERAAMAFNMIAKDGGNNAPGLMERWIKKPSGAALDWKKLLNEFLQETVSDYSFSPPDRRFADTDFFLPDFNEKEFATIDILFMVDTSGSVDDEMLSAVYAEICGVIEQFHGKMRGKLGFFDAQVTLPIPFETVEEVRRIVPYGGGGTDFRVIFDYLRTLGANDLPGCIVIFTDGEGPYPRQAAAMGIPVLWLVNNTRITPPWGKTVRTVQAK